MKDQLSIPAVEKIVRRHTFCPPSYGDFAIATVQAFDQSLNNTGMALLRSWGGGITLLATAMIRPSDGVKGDSGWEGSYDLAEDIGKGIAYHRTGYASMSDHVLYERPPIKGKRLESIVLAGREVHRVTGGTAIMVDNRHAKKVILGRAGTKANPVTKAHVKEAVESYIYPPETSGKIMPWNEHVRDACLLALTWLYDEKQRQLRTASVNLGVAA